MYAYDMKLNIIVYAIYLMFLVFQSSVCVRVYVCQSMLKKEARFKRDVLCIKAIWFDIYTYFLVIMCTHILISVFTGMFWKLNVFFKYKVVNCVIVDFQIVLIKIVFIMIVIFGVICTFLLTINLL